MQVLLIDYFSLTRRAMELWTQPRVCMEFSRVPFLHTLTIFMSDNRALGFSS